LTHLLREAIKRAPANGSVRVRVEPTADLIRITVSDNGMDISAEELALTFDRFRAIHAHPARGAVLTLYVCKRIIQQHGGRVWAARNAAGENTLGFTLPR
jgi:signal transduction histidine kinase